jgi:uncharacterized membrane protein (UPF0127 family)
MKQKQLLINGHVMPTTVTVAQSFFSRLKGLMWKKSMPAGGLLIVPCSGIHTFFMKFPIDVVFINKDDKVAKIVDNLAPWKIALPGGFSRSVLELPAGKALELKLRKGDILTLR